MDPGWAIHVPRFPKALLLLNNGTTRRVISRRRPSARFLPRTAPAARVCEGWHRSLRLESATNMIEKELWPTRLNNINIRTRELFEKLGCRFKHHGASFQADAYRLREADLRCEVIHGERAEITDDRKPRRIGASSLLSKGRMASRSAFSSPARPPRGAAATFSNSLPGAIERSRFKTIDRRSRNNSIS
jgi:hypothetical protein